MWTTSRGDPEYFGQKKPKRTFPFELRPKFPESCTPDSPVSWPPTDPLLTPYKIKKYKDDYYNSKITELEENAEVSDKKRFWECLKSMVDTRKDKDLRE